MEAGHIVYCSGETELLLAMCTANSGGVRCVDKVRGIRDQTNFIVGSCRTRCHGHFSPIELMINL